MNNVTTGVFLRFFLGTFLFNIVPFVIAQHHNKELPGKSPSGSKTVIKYDTVYLYDTIYVKKQDEYIPQGKIQRPDFIKIRNPNAQKWVIGMKVDSSIPGAGTQDLENPKKIHKNKRSIINNIPSIRLGRSAVPYDWSLSIFYAPLQHTHNILLYDKDYEEWEGKLKNAAREVTGNTFGFELGLAQNTVRPAISFKITTLNERPNFYDNVNVADSMQIFANRGELSNWSEKAVPFVYDKLKFIEVPITINTAFSYRSFEFIAGAGIGPSILLSSTATHYADVQEYHNNNSQTIHRNTIRFIHFNWNLELETRYYFYKEYYFFIKPYYSKNLSKVYSHPFLNYNYNYTCLNFGIGYKLKAIPLAESIKPKRRKAKKLPKPK